MKKIYLIAFCLIAFASANAQYVAMKDTAVMRYFKQLCPTCFKGDSLNTGNFNFETSQGSPTSVDISNRGVKDLSDFQYFGWGGEEFMLPNLYNVHSFDCSNNNITTLNPLPLNYWKLSITNFNCSNNNITDSILYTQPYAFGAINYNISNNKFKALPRINANLTLNTGNYSMVTINASNNLLSGNLSLSSGLVGNLDVSNNHYTSLSVNDNDDPFNGNHFHFNAINISHNDLTKMPKLYSDYGNRNRIFLNLSYNNISYFDTTMCNNYTAAPEVGLNLSHTNFSNLAYNQFDYLSQFYYLTYLDISNNSSINYLPSVPNFLENINCKNTSITCLPHLHNGLTLQIDSPQIHCIPNYGNFTVNGKSSYSYPICSPTNNPNQCQSFPTFVGKVFLDKDSDGIKNGADKYLNNIKVSLSNNNYVFTDNNGNFGISADTLGLKTIKIAAPKYFTAFPDSINCNFISYDSVKNVGNIGVRLTTIIDSLSLFTTATIWAARPGFLYPVHVQFQNLGTTDLTPNFVFKYNNTILSFDSSSNTGIVSNGDSLSLTSTTLLPMESRSFVLYFTVNPTANIGDTLFTNAYVIAGNAKAVDTSYAFIRGSYDPNDKQATPQLTTTQVATGKYIDYTIRFQNTGNDTAFTVVIADTLSSLLQANTFQMINSSHNCKTTINGNKIYFEFFNILLPDSNVNLLGSNGYVRFRVKPITTLILGNVVPNNAAIYFDYNAPVLTNVANTIIKNPAVVTPLKITSYDLKAKNEMQVENIWATINEINVSHFNIQRSANARDFITVGKVKANNKSSNEYMFYDSPSVEGLGLGLYYRIAAVDNDGKMSYTEVKKVQTNQLTNQLINIYPNPTKGLLHILIPFENKAMWNITVQDVLGKVLQQQHTTAITKSIDMELGNQKGLYFIIFTNTKTNKKIVKKVVVE